MKDFNSNYDNLELKTETLEWKKLHYFHENHWKRFLIMV
jgi:hypothetical protein